MLLNYLMPFVYVSMSSFVKSIYSALFENWVILLFVIELYKFFYCLTIKSLIYLCLEIILGFFPES